MTHSKYAQLVHATRKTLERQLADQVSQAIGAFYEQTGMGILDVTVNLEDATQRSDTTQRMVVHSVVLTPALPNTGEQAEQLVSQFSERRMH